ncbi:DUF58 domain-containing protein [Sulfurimonas paralvinellae]|uniref:DUF58 domain-containing protein n=1 Tax=Sulfurimonas paralvinellae TaxID=317658 RepID=A0A7M1B7I9_9BACT|nr:DUF58 domain-containing protein [Sulfurimonas paralvinellae]QOP45673.1 DUF58 domain-containing protein [Sulfurimonas paralvinellae]
MLQFFAKNKIVILLFTTFVIIYLIAVNRGIELLYVIAELSLSMLILSLIAPYFNLLGIHASLKHPKYAQQRKSMPISIELSSANFFNKFFLELWLPTPFSSNEKHMFFVKVLNSKLTIKSELSLELRGVHSIGPLIIQTGFPMGLQTFSKTFEETKGEIVVYPKPLEVIHFPFISDEYAMLYGENKSKKKGGEGEFVSIREYKRGDSPRHIHWPSSAKKGELIVREYQDFLSSSLIIMLDLDKEFNRGSFTETTLEYAISIAASLAVYGLDNGYSVSIFGKDEEEIKLIDIKGSHNQMEILKALAHVKGNGDVRYLDAVKYFHGLKKGGTLILFDNGSGKVEQNIDLLSARSSKPVLFDIQAESFINNKTDENFTLNNHPKYNKYTLKKGCDIQRMFL